MRLGVWLVLGGVGLGWLGACGKAGPGGEVGGETHWLKRCSSSEQCGGDLECLCGVCTTACDDDASCSELQSAQCSPRTATAYAGACKETAPARLCVRSESSEPDESLPIQGRRYDEDARCLRRSELAGFIRSSEPLSCDDAITYATDGESCWEFPSTCLPEGFTALELPLIDSLCAAAGPCDVAATCAEGQVSTPDGCLACDVAFAGLNDDLSDLVSASGWDACNSDLDCDVVSWQFGCADSGCGTPLAASSAQTFLAEAPGVVAEHCSDPAEWTTRCPQPAVLCAPPGPICRQGRCVNAGPPCAERSLNTCEADGDCALARANPFDIDQQCFAQATTALGCVDPDLSCPPVTTPALDGDGNCFLFGNCLPAGFERAPDDHACWQALASTCSN